MKKYLFIITLSLTLLIGDTIYIPQDFQTIQEGINASLDEDIILISEGIYFESMINSHGKDIIISGEIDEDGYPLVTIDGQGELVIFLFNGADGPGCTIENMVIKNASGNAIWMYSSNPIIKNCILSENIGSETSSIWGSDSNPWIDNCTFIYNTTDIIFQNYSDAIITDCIFVNNQNMNSIILTQSSYIDLINSEFNGNNINGGQITLYGYNDGSDASIQNCSFHNYENSILNITRTNLEITNSEFKNNNTDGPLIIINEEEPISVIISNTNFCGNNSSEPDTLIEGPWTNSLNNTFSSECLADCNIGYIEINNLCFYEEDINILQKLINNSIESGEGQDCDPNDIFCGSPNPYMDQEDAWFWVIVDDIYYQSGSGNGFQNENGVVEPLELGIQEWENGHLTSLMCGAYIYCQLSGPIPEEIGNFSEISVLRLEYNYLSGFIPETICNLNINNDDYLEFDLTGNYLCPPYPECISTSGFWSQNTSFCNEIGDINFDNIINILDILILVSFILDGNFIDYQTLVIVDINSDETLDILDIIEIVNIILN